MKKRVCAVALCVWALMTVCTNWRTLLTGVGTLTARFILSDGFSLLPLFDGQAAGEGYEESFFSAQTTVARQAKTVNLSMSSGKYATVDGLAVKNGTDQSVDIAEMLRTEFKKPTLRADEPAVLIYHTHAAENYLDTSGSTSGVIEVGEAMKAVFETAGLQTVHLTDDFTKGGSFNTSYTRSLAGVEKVLEQYPSIQIVIDLHRDSITEDGTACCPLTDINGEGYAQVMLICGTDDKGLEHPNWRTNLRYALALAQTMQADFPALCRPINLNANRYNTHTTPFALLAEIGTEQNTTAEALRAGRALAQSILKTVQ